MKEYKVVQQLETGVKRFPATKLAAGADYERMLNGLAEEGWELVTQIKIDVGVDKTPFLVFSRVKKPPGKS